MALTCRPYGTLGRQPDTFFTDNLKYISGKDEYYGYTLATILVQYQPKIINSQKTNDKRAEWINGAILFGIAAPLVVLVGFMITLF